jgi:molybdate-binding protein
MDVQKFKDFIKRLKSTGSRIEKENETKTDTIVYLLKKQEFYETEKLKQFAERLKSKDCSVPVHKGFILIEDHAIDETLKEFINK